MSAGAILLTPSIDTAQSVGDDLTGADADHTALGLVDFHFWPHYVPSDDAAAQAQARKLGATIYAAEDGGGVLVRGSEVLPIGRVRKFKS